MHLFLQPIFNCQGTLLIAKINAERGLSATFTADTRGLLKIRCGVWIQGGIGGADRDRTDDPLLAKQVLSQLSYSPIGPARWIED